MNDMMIVFEFFNVYQINKYLKQLWSFLNRKLKRRILACNELDSIGNELSIYTDRLLYIVKAKGKEGGKKWIRLLGQKEWCSRL